jgi:gamma-glutamyltranspeptidase/glutathione hydrolase
MAAACSGSGDQRGPAADFVGGAAVDEPRAALVARDILAAGGSAADAASAAYFALSVTLPGRATLGGGGACLVFDPVLGRVETVDFMTRPAAQAGSPVPMNARGFFVLQGRYGRLRWEQVVAPGEAMARFGVQISRAQASELAENASRIAASPELSRLFRPAGALPREGERFVQPDLAEILGAIRSRGANEFHAGSAGVRFAAAARTAGGAFSAADLAAAAPQFRAPLSVSLQDMRVSFLPPPAQAGIMQGQLWQMLAPRWAQTPRERRGDLSLDAQLRALADAGRWGALDLEDFGVSSEAVSARRAQALMAASAAPVPSAAARAVADSSATTTIVTVDREGGAVACAVTAGEEFGAGRVANGVILASPQARPSASLGVVMATRSIGGVLSLSQRADSAQFVFAGGGGGIGGAAVAVGAGLGTVVERATLDRLIEQPRVVVDGALRILAEPGATAPGAVPASVRLGRLNAVACPAGLVDEPTACRVRTDPRGDGLAVGGVR